jgi:hypothetical protein
MALLAPSAGSAQQPRPRGKRLWVTSALSLAAASVLDTTSSLGRYEANPLLRNTQGRFSAGRAVAWKSGAIGGTLLAQFLAARKKPHDNLYRPLTIMNFGATGLVSATAVRNYRHPRWRLRPVDGPRPM